ncbi:MAG: N-acetylmannosamine-6-phosphate 2-epimerase [Bacteroidetes bacterium]|nr:N-acetylmannosamine-6-phosphate 2-epimerase [Bacteroidota bacterium]
MTYEDLLEALQNGLIVSCHADELDEEAQFSAFLYFVHSAIRGGAAGLRIEGPERIRLVRPLTRIPIIGFVHGNYEDGSTLITPALDDIARLVDAGADIVAIDATKRKRPGDTDGFLFFEQARKRFTSPLWADISNFREGVRAAEMGADVIATTLAGYTPSTSTSDYRTPDYALIRELSVSLTHPVIAEGRIWAPADASHCLTLGAHAVVVGSAITRPQIITQMFVDEMRQA